MKLITEFQFNLTDYQVFDQLIRSLARNGIGSRDLAAAPIMEALKDAARYGYAYGKKEINMSLCEDPQITNDKIKLLKWLLQEAIEHLSEHGIDYHYTTPTQFFEKVRQTLSEV